MAVIKNKSKVRTYVLAADRAAYEKAKAEGAPRPVVTVFKWRVPSAEFVSGQELAFVELIEVAKLEGKSLQGMSEADLLKMIRPEKMASFLDRFKEWCKECLVGWSDLNDDEGNAVPFAAGQDGKATDETLAYIQPFWQELGHAFMAHDEVTVDELVK